MKFKDICIASCHLLWGGFILLFQKNNTKPVYRGLKYFLKHPSYQQTLRLMKADPDFSQLVAVKYEANTPVPWDMIQNLPPQTLGYEYAKFMAQQMITPINQLPEAGETIDPETDYIRARVRFTHDLHHVALGYPATALGEVAISAFYVAQIRSPLNAIVMAVGLIKTTLKYPQFLGQLMEAICMGWFQGQRSTNLFGVKWEQMWAMPLSEVRSQLKIEETQGESFFSRSDVLPTARLS